MLKKFIEGLAFGSGFAIAFMAVWFVTSLFVFPIYFESEYTELRDTGGETAESAVHQPAFNDSFGGDVPFFELPVEEQIADSSVIILARNEPSPDGRVKAIVREILKLEPDTTFYYEVGDEYPAESYYPGGETVAGDGVVIFFTGSPATMRMSTSFSDDRIRGLGDIPLELFREKCADDEDGI